MNCTRHLFSIALAIALLLCGTAALADNVLTLPAGLKTIEEEAFYGDTSIDSVTLPQGILEIRARAFANSSLKTVNLPDSLTFIADDAFDGPDYVRVTVNPDTYAYTWADRMGYLLLAPTQNASRGHINKVILSWNSIEDADSYNVYYGISENIAEASEITGIEETSYTVTGLLSGTTYYTWVKAVYSDRVGPASNMESAITYPDVPTLENPTVSGNSIALNWNAVTGATTYRIYYNTENDYNTATLVDKIRNTTYTLADLEYDTIYYIWIASANTSGGLRTTTPKIVSTEADSFAPVQKASKGLRNKVTVSWEPVENADSYHVYYGTSDSISEATEITGITETSYDIENLLSGTMYYTWVKAVNTERVSSASNMKNVITYPDAPTLNDPEVSGNSISLNWNAVTGAALYRIYYNTTTDVNTATTIDITQDTA